MTGKKRRPSTEPMYSGGTHLDFPRIIGFHLHDYTDFVSGNIKGTQRILISQSMHDRCFSGCFATSKLYCPKPALAWGNRKKYEAFEMWKNTKSKNIYSLACDEKFGFGVFLMEGFGTSQSIVTSMYKGNIRRQWDEGLRAKRPQQKGKGVDIHKAIGKLPKPKKGWTLPGHNYTGPYNPLEKQLRYDPATGEILEYYVKPSGKTDAVAAQHDVDYSLCGNDRRCKNKADRKMVAALDAIPWKERQ